MEGRGGSDDNATIPMNLGRLRQVVNNAKKKKMASIILTDFCYRDEDEFEREVSEFYALCEFCHFNDCQQAFNRLFEDLCGATDWTTATKRQRKMFVELCLDSLEAASTFTRKQAAKALSYVVQGVFGECTDQHTQVRMMKRNNRLLKNCGALPIFVQCFWSAKTNADKNVNDGLASDAILADEDMRIYCNLLLCFLQCNSADPEVLAEIAHQRPKERSLLFLMFDTIMYYGDHHKDNRYPIKKILLLLWKCILYSMGGTSFLKEEKERKQRHASPSSNANSSEQQLRVKATKHELEAFKVSTARYKRTRQYMLHFESSAKGSFLPPPYEEGKQVLAEHYSFLQSGVVPEQEPEVQMECEVEDAGVSIIHGQDRTGAQEAIKQRTKENEPSLISFKPNKPPPRGLFPAGSIAEALYRELLPNMRRIMIHMLNLLLAVAPVGKSTSATPPPFDLWNEITQGRSGKPTATDRSRHNEIIAKAVSAILLLLLKHMRFNHPMQHAYIAQLLVDAKCILLILKLINQEPNVLFYGHTVPAFEFFTPPDESNAEEETEIARPRSASEKDEFTPTSSLCWRNYFAVVNLLRILQRLTKNKHARTQVLVKYQAQIILKKILGQIENETLRLYILKLFKNLTKLLPAKTRKANMNIISEVYLHLSCVHMDDWLHTQFVEQDHSKEFEETERKNRQLQREFNERNYPSFLPKTRKTEPSSSADSAASTEGTLLPGGEDDSDTLDANAMHRRLVMLKNNIQLDDAWCQNYERWLDEEVFCSPDNTLLSPFWWGKPFV